SKVVSAGFIPQAPADTALDLYRQRLRHRLRGMLTVMATRSTIDIPSVTLPDGTTVPQLGQGTWTMGENKSRASAEASALTAGFDLGMTLVDTAEMYGDGGAEEVVARASADRRERLFVVSKVYPHNAGRKSAIAACERSLKRLGTDRLDLY